MSDMIEKPKIGKALRPFFDGPSPILSPTIPTLGISIKLAGCSLNLWPHGNELRGKMYHRGQYGFAFYKFTIDSAIIRLWRRAGFGRAEIERYVQDEYAVGVIALERFLRENDKVEEL